MCIFLQAPLDGSSFLLASAEWPPPDASTQRGRYLAGMLADMQQDNFLVGVRVRTKQARTPCTPRSAKRLFTPKPEPKLHAMLPSEPVPSGP